MKLKITLQVIAMVALLAVAACSDDTAPTPAPTNKQDNEDPNDGNEDFDTAYYLVDVPWHIKKVYQNGVEKADNFLRGASYLFVSDGSYVFNIPSAPGAQGTWEFGDEGKHVINMYNQGPGTVFTIVSMTEEEMVVEDRPNNSDDVWRYEMSVWE